jgi:hypothetical protein
MKLEIYDPPMCCSSGVCGPRVDPVLPRFAADLEWMKVQGVAVSRYNLAQQPSAFAENEAVQAALAEDETCLPLVLVEGTIRFRRTYPTRSELAVALCAALRTGNEIPELKAPALEELAGRREKEETPAARTCCGPQDSGSPEAKGCG